MGSARSREWTATSCSSGTRMFKECRRSARVTVVNPGSVGLARDYRGKACYAVYEYGTVQLKRCPYNVARTVAALRAAPLPEAVIEGLAQVLGASDSPET